MRIRTMFNNNPYDIDKENNKINKIKYMYVHLYISEIWKN